MKKKLLSAVLSAVCILSLAACSEKAPESISESVSVISEENVAASPAIESEDVFVIMNIPLGDFDAVSGATFSTGGVLKAYEEALNKAGIEKH